MDRLFSSISAFAYSVSFLHKTILYQTIFCSTFSNRTCVIDGYKGACPLDSLYLFLYESFPLFYAFRDPSKWVVLVTFSYSFILAGLLQRILTHHSPSFPVAEKNHLAIKNRIFDKVIKKSNVALALIFFLLTSIALPFFVDGSFGGKIQTINYPSEYPNFINWLSERNIQDRLALFPPDFEIKYDWLLRSTRECRVPVCFPHTVDEQLYTYPIVSTIALRPSFIYPDTANSMTWWLYHTLYNNSTKYASQLFGLLDTKYFVIRNDAHPASYNGTYMPFADGKIRNYIDKQIGLDLVYQKGNISVYENKYALPHIYNANNLTLVVGDRNILNSLTYLHYPLMKYPVVFTDELTSEQVTELIPYVKHLILDISKYDDLYFNFIPNKYLISPNNYAPNTANASYWISSDYVVHRRDYQGHFDSELGKFIFTEGKNSTINLPVELDSNTAYDIWIRIFKDKESDVLKIGIDDKYMTEFDYHISRFDRGFGWLKVGSVQLDPGKHNINLTSDGFNAVSELALVPEHMLDSVKKKVHGLIKDYGVQIIYLSEGEKLNPIGDAHIEKVDFEASNGYVLSFRNGTAKINAYFPSDGNYNLNLRLSNLKDRNDLKVLLNDQLTPVVEYNSSEVPSTDKDFRFIRLTNVYPLHFKEGTNTLELRMKNGTLLDQLSLLPSEYNFDIEHDSRFALVSDDQDMNKKDQFKKVNPVEYNLKHGNLPITVFLETYNSGWQMNNEYSVPIFSYANAFIHPPSNNAYTIKYTPEIYYTIGKIVSILSTLVVIACTIIALIRSFHLKIMKADRTMLKEYSNER